MRRKTAELGLARLGAGPLTELLSSQHFHLLCDSGGVVKKTYQIIAATGNRSDLPCWLFEQQEDG